MPKAGGVEHVPAGWDWWMGLVGIQDIYITTTYFLSSIATHADKHFFIRLETPSITTTTCP